MIPDYTIAAKLIDKPNKDGLCPVKIVVLQNGQRMRKSTGIRVLPSQWNGEVVSHPYAPQYNRKIRQVFQAVEGQVLAGHISLKKSATDKIVGYYYNVEPSLKKKAKPGTLRHWKKEIRKVEAFDMNAAFSSITIDWLRRYEAWLRGHLANNTVHKSFKFLIKLFNMAINDGLTTNYPFKKYDCPKYIQTSRTFLTEDEVNGFADKVKDAEGVDKVSGMYFLLGCYSGLRLSDWQKFNAGMIQGDRLILRATKNGELVSMQMHKRLKAVVDELLTLSKCPAQRELNLSIRKLAVDAKITKHLSAHISRHTFAVRCAELGISIETTARMLGISEIVCRVYYQITDRKIDNEFAAWDR